MPWIRSGKRQQPWENGEDPKDAGRGGTAACVGPPSKCLPSEKDSKICSEGRARHSLLVSFSPPLAKKLYIFINMSIFVYIPYIPWSVICSWSAAQRSLNKQPCKSPKMLWHKSLCCGHGRLLSICGHLWSMILNFGSIRLCHNTKISGTWQCAIKI